MSIHFKNHQIKHNSIFIYVHVYSGKLVPWWETVLRCLLPEIKDDVKLGSPRGVMQLSDSTTGIICIFTGASYSIEVSDLSGW